MKNTYPVIMTKGNKFVVVYIPDFDINTQGVDYTEAIEMARDAIGLVGIDMEDDGEALPIPSDVSEIIVEGDSIVTLVDVDFTEYRRINELRSVKKNCTIPSWLNEMAEKAGINFSAVLQNALKKELKVTDR